MLTLGVYNMCVMSVCLCVCVRASVSVSVSVAVDACDDETGDRCSRSSSVSPFI
jgi:hypothetical protein